MNRKQDIVSELKLRLKIEQEKVRFFTRELKAILELAALENSEDYNEKALCDVRTILKYATEIGTTQGDTERLNTLKYQQRELKKIISFNVEKLRRKFKLKKEEQEALSLMIKRQKRDLYNLNRVIKRLESKILKCKLWNS